MELQVSIDLNPCGQAGLFSFLFGVHNARGIFFGYFFFFLDRKILSHIINRSQIQTATSEAITTSKNLGISSTHASKHYYYYYFEVISSFGSKYYLYMLIVFRKLIMTLKNIKNTPILIR